MSSQTQESTPEREVRRKRLANTDFNVNALAAIWLLEQCDQRHDAEVVLTLYPDAPYKIAVWDDKTCGDPMMSRCATEVVVAERGRVFILRSRYVTSAEGFGEPFVKIWRPGITTVEAPDHLLSEGASAYWGDPESVGRLARQIGTWIEQQHTAQREDAMEQGYKEAGLVWTHTEARCAAGWIKDGDGARDAQQETSGP